MQTTFARDRFDVRRPLRDALAERPGKALRLRLQPAILRCTGLGKTHYRSWRGVAWTAELQTVREAASFLDALAAFFAALNTSTPEQLTALLKAQADKAAAAGQPVDGHHGNQEVPA